MAGDSAGFESYLRGSWWDVHIDMERSSMFLVSYNADRDEEKAWVPLTELRLSSRRSHVWDCSFLKKGMDVAVLAKHPHSNDLNLEKEGLYDARVSSITKRNHLPGECTCTVNLHFLSLIMDTYVDGSLLDRVLLTDEPETQVSISDIRILQKPSEIIPLEDILEAHQAGKWIAFNRGCQDAMFLTETDLSTAKRRHGADVQSIAIFSPSPARVSTKNGEKGSNSNSPVDGPEQEALGTHQIPRTPQAEYRIPNSASGGAENQKEKQSGGYVDGASPQSERYADGARPQSETYADGAGRQAGECADGASPQGVSPQRKLVPIEDRDDGQPNERVEEVPPPKRKCGRPRLNKDKAKYPLKEGKVEEYLRPRLDKNLRDGHKESLDKEKTPNNTKEQSVDLEWTENVNALSSDESDSEGEWKPHGLKNFPTTPYNIRTRGEKTATELNRQTRASRSRQVYSSGSD